MTSFEVKFKVWLEAEEWQVNYENCPQNQNQSQDQIQGESQVPPPTSDPIQTRV